MPLNRSLSFNRSFKMVEKDWKKKQQVCFEVVKYKSDNEL